MKKLCEICKELLMEGECCYARPRLVVVARGFDVDCLSRNVGSLFVSAGSLRAERQKPWDCVSEVSIFSGKRLFSVAAN